MIDEIRGSLINIKKFKFPKFMRLDFFVKKDGNVFLNEIEPLACGKFNNIGWYQNIRKDNNNQPVEYNSLLKINNKIIPVHNRGLNDPTDFINDNHNINNFIYPYTDNNIQRWDIESYIITKLIRNT